MWINFVLFALFPKNTCGYNLDHNNVTAYDHAAFVEIPFVQNLRMDMRTGRLNAEQMNLAESYIQDFEDAHHGLPGFLEANLQRKVEIILRNGISKYRFFHRLYHFHPQLYAAGIQVPEYLPPYNGSRGFFPFQDFREAQAGIVYPIAMLAWNVSKVAAGYILDENVGTRLYAKHCYELSGAAWSLCGSHTVQIELLEVALDLVKIDGSMNQSIIETALTNAIIRHDERYDKYRDSYIFNRKLGPLRKQYPESYREMRYPLRLTKGFMGEPGGDICLFGDLRSEEMRRKLFCWLDSEQDPYWKVQPLKVEQIGESPDIFQVHSVYGEKAIRAMKQTYVQNLEEDWLFVSYPVEQRHFIQKRIHVQNENVTKPHLFIPTLEKLTGLNFTLGSSWLIFNAYTAGEFQATHSDFASINPFEQKSFIDDDDVLASVLITLEKPETGGGTMFTSARAIAEPLVGSVMLWYSLTSDGFHDARTGHAGCPPIFGRKWNTVKWFFYKDQFRRHRCGLKKYETVQAFKIPEKISAMQEPKRHLGLYLKPFYPEIKQGEFSEVDGD